MFIPGVEVKKKLSLFFKKKREILLHFFNHFYSEKSSKSVRTRNLSLFSKPSVLCPGINKSIVPQEKPG
jgi:hypothetical protein